MYTSGTGTLRSYLSENYQSLVPHDFHVLSDSYDLNLELERFDKSIVDDIVCFYLQSKCNNNNEDDIPSIFETRQEPPPRTMQVVLREIAQSMGDQTKFKVLCNKLYSLTEAFQSDPQNPINTFVGLMNEDFMNNEDTKRLVTELCIKQGMIAEGKPKGLIVKIPKDIFIGQIVALHSVLNKLKDQSLGITATKKLQMPTGPQSDPHRNERNEVLMQNPRMRDQLMRDYEANLLSQNKVSSKAKQKPTNKDCLLI